MAFVKISDKAVVNTKNVAGLLFNPTTLKTLVFVVGLPGAVESDYSLVETEKLINQCGETK